MMRDDAEVEDSRQWQHQVNFSIVELSEQVLGFGRALDALAACVGVVEAYLRAEAARRERLDAASQARRERRENRRV